jgi:hypothetical protein
MNGFEIILPFLKPIEHLILDDAISEVMVNGHDHIFIEKAGFIEPVQDVILGEKSLMVAVKNIARRLGDDISESKPILDSRLPDGSRVAAVIPPCSVDGVTLTIRKFNARHFASEDLVQAGTLERWLANQLEATFSLERTSSSLALPGPVRLRCSMHSENSFPPMSVSCSSRTPLKFIWARTTLSVSKRGNRKTVCQPSPFGIF